MTGGSLGQPVWRALAVLVLLPLAVATVAGGASVRAASRSAGQALRAQLLVSAVEQLDAARRSADAEVLPTLLIVVLRNRDQAARLGFAPSRQTVLRATEPGLLRQARAASDDALDAAIAGSRGAFGMPAELAAVRTALFRVRAGADDGSGGLQTVTTGYAAVARQLARAQRAAGVRAISSGLSAPSVGALQDLDLIVQLSEAGSAQLGELFASRVLPAPAAAEARARWIGSWGAYTQLLAQSDRLDRSVTRRAWAVFAGTVDVTTFSDLLERQALNPRQIVLETGALPGLGARSQRRDDAVAVVLDYAVDAASEAARKDRTAAVARERVMLAAVLLVVALSLVYAGLVARWLAASMKALAASAQKVSLGHLVDVHPRGPRELRTAATALSAAVGGLRRVQEQARAVAAGDPEGALRVEPLPGPLGTVVHASVEQIVTVFQAREQLRRELAHQADHDALTGLPNRAATLRRLVELLSGGPAAGQHVGVLFIDLDGFKAVNDGHGHAAGDELLREIGRRLAAGLRGRDGVGRIGGDEFVATVVGVRDTSELVDVGHRLISAVRRPVTLTTGSSAVRVQVGASIGVAISTPAVSPDGLLAEADQAAYRAKRAGRGRVEVFDEAMRAELAEHAEMDAALRLALNAGELRLAYQPVVDLVSGMPVGYEALARWNRPGTGPVPPDVFIAVAEASALICDLGRWALGTATAQLAGWRARGVAGFDLESPVQPTVAVNISGRHIADPRILADVRESLQASGLPPHLLVLEITETVLSGDQASTIRHLHELRADGVQVAIDDFGTGYTSIGALSRTPVQVLKIDRAFVDSDDPRQLQLATLMIGAARTFSIRVVAEGIETEAQLDRLIADGCHEGQGYLFSRAITPEAVEELKHPLSPSDRPDNPANTGTADRRLPAQRSTP